MTALLITWIFICLVIIGIYIFYLTMIVPNQENKKGYHPKDYNIDLLNLSKCISNATNKHQIKMVCHAVHEFKIANKDNKKVFEDVDKLIDQIDSQYFKIKYKTKNYATKTSNTN